jgi:hypothetical protein
MDTARTAVRRAGCVAMAPPDELDPQQQRGVLDWYLEVG